MKTTQEQDREYLKSIPIERLLDLKFIHVHNIWSEDGLYFLGIEKRYGTKAATEIDREVWAVMGKLESRRLAEVLKPETRGLPELFEALKLTSWWLDMERKSYTLTPGRLVITNNECRVQLTRQKKNLGEFNCKEVRLGFLENFAKEFNPTIKVTCHFCPLDPHPEDAWCEWEFSLE